MRTLTPGHDYLVQQYAPDHSVVHEVQQRRFVKKVGKGFPGNELPEQVGTNCQEELRVIIDRVEYLQGQEACVQNVRILELLRNVLYLFEYRAAERKDKLRDLFMMEGLRSDLQGIEKLPTCPICGHIFPHTHQQEESAR